MRLVKPSQTVTRHRSWTIRPSFFC